MKQRRHILYAIIAGCISMGLLPPYALRAASDAPVEVIKSVGINTDSAQQSYFPSTASAADLYPEQTLTTYPTDPVGSATIPTSAQLLKFLQNPTLNAVIIITIITAYLGFAILLIVFKKHRKNPALALWHWLGFFLKKPSLIFLQLAPVEADSRWVHAFQSFKKYHRTTQVLALASILALIVKISLTAGVTLYLLDKTRAEVTVAQLQDNGQKVHPLDILTYRLDWNNISGQIIPTLEVRDSIPAGTTFVEGSINSSTGHNEQSTIERSGTTSQVRTNIEQLLPGDTGYVIYKVQVNIPSSEAMITSQAGFSSQGVTWNSNSVSNPVETGSIGDLIWKDDDSNQEKNGTEQGLSGVTVALHLDRGDPQSLNTASDPLLLTAITDDKGRYNFSGITAATYWVIIDPATLPAQAAATFNASPKKIALSFSNWISLEKTADYNGADFGFFVPEPAPEPIQPAAEDEETESSEPETEGDPPAPAPPETEETPPDTKEESPQPKQQPTENKEQAAPQNTKTTPLEKSAPAAEKPRTNSGQKLAQTTPSAETAQQPVVAPDTAEAPTETTENSGGAAADGKLAYEKPPLTLEEEQWNEASSYPENPGGMAPASDSLLKIIILLSITAFIAIISTVSHLQPDRKKPKRTKKATRRT